MVRPYALASCGHTWCYQWYVPVRSKICSITNVFLSLISWFRSPPPEMAAEDLPEHMRGHLDKDDPSLLALDSLQLLRKKKTCPQCRAVVRQAPIEAWGLKNIFASLVSTGLAKELYPDTDSAVSLPRRATGTQTDVWKGIFFRSSGHGLVAHAGNQHAGGAYAEALHGDHGYFDEEDDIYRCTQCHHEILDGACSSCGRIYPGLIPELDDILDDINIDDMDFAHFYDANPGDALYEDALPGEDAAEEASEDDDEYESDFIDDRGADGGSDPANEVGEADLVFGRNPRVRPRRQLAVPEVDSDEEPQADEDPWANGYLVRNPPMRRSRPRPHRTVVSDGPEDDEDSSGSAPSPPRVWLRRRGAVVAVESDVEAEVEPERCV